MSVDDFSSNKSGNRSFNEILEVNLERRKVLTGGLAAAATGFFGGIAITGCNNTSTPSSVTPSATNDSKSALMTFKPVPVEQGHGNWPRISEDYEFQTLIPWGTPIHAESPLFNYPPSAADQTQQIGIGHDGMTFFPIKHEDHDTRNLHGVLAINHEFGRNSHVLGKAAPESLEDVRVSQHAHGVSIVEIRKHSGIWSHSESDKNRRIHVNTPVTFSGPAAGHPLLETKAGNAPAGTVNNCSNGQTPWGTYLTCEENFNGYFGATGDWTANEAQERYGFRASGFGYGWENFDERFDLSSEKYKSEENRFGWVVEIDPMDPLQTPVKRTALGRIKHEGVAITVGEGNRVVAYMGDDQRFDYIYKFVSSGDWETMMSQGIHPLDDGKLYVARFNENGSGNWLELSIKNKALAKHFNDQAEILTFARMAADLLGATPMDRPEWTTVAPNGDIYCTLTNNSRRTAVNAANPMTPNYDGHIIKWHDSDNHTGETFKWEIFLIAEKTHGSEKSFSSPDGIWADPDGRLFIQTDGGQKDGLNNQMLVADTHTGEIRRLFTGVTKNEITGIAYTPDRRTMFINIQHPGNGNPRLTNFPGKPDGVSIPRDATVVITRKDSGIIGS